MKWFDIPSELVLKLRELQNKDSHYSIVRSEDAVVMFYGMGDPVYLTFDGRVIIEECFIEEKPPREAKTLIEATMAIVVGPKVRKCPELLSLLPLRPNDAKDCAQCERSGWIKFNDDMNLICHECGGLGWKL